MSFCEISIRLFPSFFSSSFSIRRRGLPPSPQSSSILSLNLHRNVIRSFIHSFFPFSEGKIWIVDCSIDCSYCPRPPPPSPLPPAKYSFDLIASFHRLQFERIPQSRCPQMKINPFFGKFHSSVECWLYFVIVIVWLNVGCGYERERWCKLSADILLL